MPSVDPAVPPSAYRADIDGLRAIAVLAVVAHHLHPALLPAGFLGVDVFFVVSGYVVTSALAGQPAADWRTRLLAFYARRVRRLLPALLACALVTGLAGRILVGSPEDSLRTGLAAVAAASNLYLWSRSDDYFGPAAESNLFTHTWSLGVEEQFYLLFPTLLAVAGFWRPSTCGARSPRVVAVVLALAAVSLGTWALLVDRAPIAAFFLMPTRFWQLGLGCLTFVLVRGAGERGHGLDRLLAPAALLALLGALAWGTRPQAAALLVSAATAAALWSVPGSRPVLAALSVPWVVAVGLGSYSLYLWHWPVVVLARWTIGLTPLVAPLLLLVMAALAAASYLFLEKPLRHSRWARTDARTIGIGLGASAAVALVLALLAQPFAGALYAGAGQAATTADEDQLTGTWSQGSLVWSAERCSLRSKRDVGRTLAAEDCAFGDWRGARRRVLVLGDSSAAAEVGMVGPLAGQDGMAFAVVSSFGAAPVPEGAGLSRRWRETSQDHWQRLVPGLLDELRPGDVAIMVHDLAPYLPAKGEDGAEAIEARRRQLARGLERLAADLEQRGVGLVYQSANPFYREAGPGCAPQFVSSPDAPRCHFLTREESLRRRQPVHNALLRVQAAHPRFRVLDLFPELCPGERCTFWAADGTLLVRDSFGHLTDAGAARGSAALLEVLRRLPPPP